RKSADAPALELIFVNPVAELLLGYSLDEWFSTPEFWLAVVHPEDRERAADEVHARWAGSEPQYPQLRWVTKDGRVRWFEAHVSVVCDSMGNPVGLRSLNLDVTARVRAEEKLAEAQRALIESRRALIESQRAVSESQRALREQMR